MRKVNGYSDFLNESQFELLLEANIQYLPKFKKVLSKIDTKISNELLKLMDTEVDINTNYIDIDDNKNFIKFVPDDRVKDLTYIISENDANHSLYYSTINNYSFYPMDNIRIPNPGSVCTIFKTFKDGEIDNLFTGSSSYHKNILKPGVIFCHIKFDYVNHDDDYTEECNAIVVKSSLTPYLGEYKSMEFKIGKFASSMLKKVGIEFTNVELEDFVNKYKAQIEIRQGLFDKFEIVKGEDIRRYYLHNEYNSQNGSLGNSCMKYKRCQAYLDIYVQNSNISMLILKSEYGILGRTILWLDTKGRKIMDRIYTNNSADEELFKEYAKRNKFYYKASQDYTAMSDLVFNDVIIKAKEDLIIIVELDKRGVDYDYYPFMDTLKYINISDGTLTNDADSERGYDYELEGTTGYHDCDTCNGRENIDCEDCNGNGRVDCEECNGVGTIPCDFCNGEPVTCPECDGENSECEFCEGEPVTCPECDGEEMSCDNCYGGRHDCDSCDGDGEKPCTVCTSDD